MMWRLQRIWPHPSAAAFLQPLRVARWSVVGARAAAASPRQAAAEIAAARAQQQKKAAEARARGAVSIDTHLVDGLFSVGVGLFVGAWWLGWLDVKTSEVDLLVARLRGLELSVVVFELDPVMCARRSDSGIPNHELEDYLHCVSQDFLELAAALARRGFHLAVVADGQQPPPPRKIRERQVLEQTLWGPELAKALISRRCPEAAPSFKIVLGPDEPERAASRDQQMHKIAAFYGVPVGQLVLFTGSPAHARHDADGWRGILVKNPHEGFRMDDSHELELPSRLDWLRSLGFPSVWLPQGRAPTS
mmetsp:Transcript_100201/g.323248  ORF Transcript_100201/g.323248 Transcript_100201/m.323248 type:complete len:305 (-) Transcript_100201:267-1181(-)